MKADVQSQAEKEALDWAVDCFRYHSRLEAYIKNEPKEESQRHFRLHIIRRYDRCRHDKDKFAEFADWISTFTAEDAEVLRQAVADLLERGDHLPKPLADFAAASLRDPREPTKVIRGRKPSMDKAGLDALMAVVMHHIAETWGFKPTRNVASAGLCAASIVKAALKTGAGIRVSESRVAAAWRNRPTGLEV